MIQQMADLNHSSEPVQYQSIHSGHTSRMCPSRQQIIQTRREDTVVHSEEGDRHDAEMLAAKRSLITNIVFLSLTVVINIGLYFTAANVRPFFSAVVLSVLKGALPICMTITNFGTVQFVIVQYWQYLKALKTL